MRRNTSSLHVVLKNEISFEGGGGTCVSRMRTNIFLTWERLPVLEQIKKSLIYT